MLINGGSWTWLCNLQIVINCPLWLSMLVTVVVNVLRFLFRILLLIEIIFCRQRWQLTQNVHTYLQTTNSNLFKIFLVVEVTGQDCRWRQNQGIVSFTDHHWKWIVVEEFGITQNYLYLCKSQYMTLNYLFFGDKTMCSHKQTLFWVVRYQNNKSQGSFTHLLLELLT